MNRRQALLGAAALSACGGAKGGAATPAPFPMRRGINLGNALEAPNEGDWGYRIESAHLIAIAEAGFDGVRLPVRWDAHTDAEPPHMINSALMQRVGDIIDQCLALGLHIQLDCHHYEALIADPRAERARFLSIWRQIAAEFQSAPARLLFEPLNEPNGGALDGTRLTELQREALAVIRETNPERLVVLGPGNWQNIDALARWTPPEGDNIAVSVHYYEPHAFTHQSAEWLGEDAPVFQRSWGERADIDAVAAHISRAADWGARRGFAVQLGEFGVNAAVPLEQRAAWTSAVREACDANSMGWCVWDFAGAFPVWNRERGAWIDELRGALAL